MTPASDFTAGLLQINPYDPTAFRDSEACRDLMSKMPRWLLPIWARCGRYEPGVHDNSTPRWQQMTGSFSMASLYYMDAVMSGNPGSVADIGCGENVFKMFYPQITGYDSCGIGADIQRQFDDEFASEHRHRFDAAVAMNSLHFVPLDGFEEQVMSLASIVKPGGMCHLTANTQRFIDHMSDSDLAAINQKHTNGTVDDSDRIAVAIRLDEIVRSMDIDWIIVDQCYDPSMDGDFRFNNPIVGNLRIVFKVG